MPNSIIVRAQPGQPIEGGDALPPLLRRLFAARGIRHADEVDFNLSRLLPYTQLPGIDQAVDLLVQAARHQSRILVVGDYDADGATATAVLVRALTCYGYQNVHYAVPSRFQYGYGLSPKLVEETYQRYRPTLIVTVDNGISSVAGVAAAKALGIQVIVTDHHLPGKTLPEAAAIVNPNLPHSNFPSRALAGVGVAFHTMAALRSRLSREAWFGDAEPPPIKNLLDLVALGTVADLVPMDANNRILVDYGLRLIRAGRAHAGIQALFKVAGRQSSVASSSDLGFAIAPRLNAAGRLQDMEKGIACLLCDNQQEATLLARELNALNKARQVIEGNAVDTAWSKIAHQISQRRLIHKQGLCLYEPDWHEGVIGLVAARVRERIGVPAFIFTRAQDGQLRGSGRSIRTIHLRDVLADIHSYEPDLMTSFGGHSQAAGISLPEHNYPRFEGLFHQTVASHMAEHADQNELFSDGSLSPDDLSYQTAQCLRTAAPWGVDFREPVFDGEFVVVNSRIVAHKHRRLTLKFRPEDSFYVRAILFNAERHAMLENALHRVHILYSLEADNFHNCQSVNLTIRHIQAVD